MNLDNKAARTKLIQEVSVLVFVVLLIGVVMLYHGGAFSAKPAAQSQQTTKLNTDFDKNALTGVKERDQNYPDVTPVDGDLGRDDPFSPATK